MNECTHEWETKFEEPHLTGIDRGQDDFGRDTFVDVMLLLQQCRWCGQRRKSYEHRLRVTPDPWIDSGELPVEPFGDELGVARMPLNFVQVDSHEYTDDVG